MTRRAYALSMYATAALQHKAARHALSALELAQLRNLKRQQHQYERTQPARSALLKYVH